MPKERYLGDFRKTLLRPWETDSRRILRGAFCSKRTPTTMFGWVWGEEGSPSSPQPQRPQPGSSGRARGAISRLGVLARTGPIARQGLDSPLQGVEVRGRAGGAAGGAHRSLSARRNFYNDCPRIAPGALLWLWLCSWCWLSLWPWLRFGCG